MLAEMVAAGPAGSRERLPPSPLVITPEASALWRQWRAAIRIHGLGLALPHDRL